MTFCPLPSLQLNTLAPAQYLLLSHLQGIGPSGEEKLGDGCAIMLIWFISSATRALLWHVRKEGLEKLLVFVRRFDAFLASRWALVSFRKHQWLCTWLTACVSSFQLSCSPIKCLHPESVTRTHSHALGRSLLQSQEANKPFSLVSNSL